MGEPEVCKGAVAMGENILHIERWEATRMHNKMEPEELLWFNSCQTSSKPIFMWTPPYKLVQVIMTLSSPRNQHHHHDNITTITKITTVTHFTPS